MEEGSVFSCRTVCLISGNLCFRDNGISQSSKIFIFVQNGCEEMNQIYVKLDKTRGWFSKELCVVSIYRPTNSFVLVNRLCKTRLNFVSGENGPKPEENGLSPAKMTPNPTDMLLTVAEIDYDERNLNGSFSYLCKQLQLNNLDIDNRLTKAGNWNSPPKKNIYPLTE